MIKVNIAQLTNWLFWCLAVGFFFGFCLGAMAVHKGWWVIP